MTVRAIAKSVYGVFGAIFLIAGVAVFLLPTGLLPGAVENLVEDIGRGDLNTLHIIQELGSVLIFVGLITFWFIRHYEQSKPFHWALAVFWGFFALAHWVDARGGAHAGTGQVINTIPFVLLLLVGLLRYRSEGKAESR
jgi:hypothetical protein